MHEQLIEKIYVYIRNHTKNLDNSKLDTMFAQSGYSQHKKTLQDEIDDFINSKIHEKQFVYIKRLSERFKDKVLFMKGILVAVDLYGDINKRRSGDIDVLVKECDVQEVGQYLLDEEFECDVLYEDWLNAIKVNHLVFNKTVFGKWDIMIEVHGKVFNPPYRYPKFTDLVWKRAKQQNILDITPLLMDPYDRIVHYVLHYYYHTVEPESLLLMGMNINLNIKSLVDIYCTIKKYDIDFNILYQRVEEIHAVLEYYEVFHVLYNFFPDICPKAFFESLKLNAISCERNHVAFWRERIPLHETIDIICSKTYWTKLSKLMEYDLTRMNCLSADKKQLFSYRDNSFECICNAYVDEEIQFEIRFSIPENTDLSNIQIVIHYHVHGKTETPYINKIVIDFIQNGDLYICHFRNGVFGKIYELRNKLTIKNGQCNFKFSVSKRFFENNIITYSMNFIDGHFGDVCVSGETWIDFKTMRHLKIESI